MAKYIDADKLKEDIQANLAAISFNDDYQEGYEACGMSVLKSIGSLQQEQQEQPTQGYDEAYLNEKIAKATKSWKGVDVDKFMDEVRGREPDKSLEEAAEDQARSFGYQEEDYEYKELVETFIAGTKWQEKRDEETIKTAEDHAFLAGADRQKEQMMKGAVEGVVEDWNPEPHPEITIPLNPEEFTAGDKVKLIVIKED